MIFLANLIGWIVQLLTLVIIANALLSFVLSPFHPLREALSRITDPLLAPIRRVVPPMGGLDFSPFVLIILLQIVERIVRSFLYNLA